jgi:hypothetical protein
LKYGKDVRELFSIAKASIEEKIEEGKEYNIIVREV